MDLFSFGLAHAEVWLLFLLRTLGFVFVAPLFSAQTVPPQFRIAFAFLLTMIAFIAWSPQAGGMAPGIQAFIPAALSELLLGMMLGFVVSLVFVAFQFAGQFIGYQMGFALVNVFDPQSQQQVSMIGQSLFVVAALAFLSLNLHHDVIGLWYQSYQVAPLGAWDLSALSLASIVALGTDLFVLALKIAMPLLIFLLLTDLALGIVARVMPQMNVFFVSIPLKIVLGLFFLSLVVLQFDPAVREVTVTFINDAGAMLVDMSG